MILIFLLNSICTVLVELNETSLERQEPSVLPSFCHTGTCILCFVSSQAVEIDVTLLVHPKVQ